MIEEEKHKFIHIENINPKSIPKNLDIVSTENKKENSKNRYNIFDNIKGILIFSVVFGHFLWKYSSYHKNSITRKIVVFIYSFHMPTFVFISGFLSSENSTKISNIHGSEIIFPLSLDKTVITVYTVYIQYIRR